MVQFWFFLAILQGARQRIRCKDRSECEMCGSEVALASNLGLKFSLRRCLMDTVKILRSLNAEVKSLTLLLRHLKQRRTPGIYEWKKQRPIGIELRTKKNFKSSSLNGNENIKPDS
ncbi:conserved hypothetical protein [Ricinus communis]|uniref:Uncharacterized protein n=1 Tax=Ricinus communis TaxID=3988 RepID=B9SZJ1_RICCO|nr:conserved hypothetical protein [Ricinus communis]